MPTPTEQLNATIKMQTKQMSPQPGCQAPFFCTPTLNPLGYTGGFRYNNRTLTRENLDEYLPGTEAHGEDTETPDQVFWKHFGTKLNMQGIVATDTTIPTILQRAKRCFQRGRSREAMAKLYNSLVASLNEFRVRLIGYHTLSEASWLARRPLCALGLIPK